MSRLWIVRHGNTFAPGEAPRRIGARTDLPLVESGRAQADALRRWFASEAISFDPVLCSPLRRTRETAGIIAGQDAIETADWLTEIDHGPDENRPEAEVEARIGATALAAWDRGGTAPEGWIVDADRRVAHWADLFRRVAERADADWLVVTSNGAARYALVADAGLAAESRQLPTRKLRTGAFGCLAFAGGALRIAAWDRRP